MIYEVLAELARELARMTGIQALVEPTLVIPDAPHLRLEASVPVLRHSGATLREFEGKAYEAQLYDVTIPVAISLCAEGQEEVLKKRLWDAAFQLSLYFTAVHAFQVTPTLEWPGSFVLEIVEAEAGFPVQQVGEEGKYPYRFVQTWNGRVRTDFYVITSAPLGRLKSIGF